MLGSGVEARTLSCSPSFGFHPNNGKLVYFVCFCLAVGCRTGCRDGVAIVYEVTTVAQKSEGKLRLEGGPW